MRRPELWLGLVVLVFVGFVGVQVATRPVAPPPVPPPVTAADDSLQRAVDDRVASGLPLDPNLTVMPSELPAPERDTVMIRQLVSTQSAGTYFAEVMAQRGGYVARWPDRRFEALRVWVQPTSTLPGFDPRFVDEARAAFGAWAPADLPVRFTFVPDAVGADVLVTWVDRFPDASGKTRWTRDQHWWIVDADIELGLHQPDGTPIPGPVIHSVAVHEVGHLLGLDHTTDERSIMSARVRVDRPSALDLATARLVYRLPPGEATGWR